MFRRIEKHIKKQQEAGFDNELRAFLGETDTDSDESSNYEDTTSGVEENEEWGGFGNGAIVVDDSEGEGEDDSEGEDEDDNEGEDEDDIAFSVFTAQQALKEPIYSHPSQSKAHLCAICPGKLLVGQLPISEHQASKAHERRLSRMSELVKMSENANRSFSELLAELDNRPQLAVPGDSKRAEKKRKAAEIRKAKREKRKKREKARKEKEKGEENKSHGNEESAELSAQATQTVLRGKKEKQRAESLKSDSKGKRKERPTEKGAKGASLPATSKAKVHGDERKRKSETEKEKVKGSSAESQPPPRKRRKMGVAEPPASVNENATVKQQIKDIAKSATLRARQALEKAKKGSGAGPSKAKGRKKKGST